jgi:multidrug resistance efflux pump
MSNAGQAAKWVLLTAIIGVLGGLAVAPHLGTFFDREEDDVESVEPLRERQVVCTGRVEATEGEIDVMPQLSGELKEVRVTEGDEAEKGDLLAVIDAQREEAAVETAKAHLDQAKAALDIVLAGTGEFEVQAALSQVDAATAKVEAQQALIEQMVENSQPSAVIKKAQADLKALLADREAANFQYKAALRGALPEEKQRAKAAVTQAESQLEEARTNYEYHRVVAANRGVVLKVYRHVGDSVQAGGPTPIVQIADTDRLRIRLEVDETEVNELEAGMEGVFTIRGSEEEVGRLKVGKMVPFFGRPALFNPDTSARVDTRTLELLCDVQECDIQLYPGQRITAKFTPKSADDED